MLATSPHVARIVQLRGNAQDPRKSLPQLAHNVRAMRGHSAVLFLYKRETIAWPWHLAAWLAGARLLHRHGYRYRDVRRNVMSDFPQHVFFQLVASNLLLGKPLANALPPRLDPPPEAVRLRGRAVGAPRARDRPVVLIELARARLRGDGPLGPGASPGSRRSCGTGAPTSWSTAAAAGRTTSTSGSRPSSARR